MPTYWITISQIRRIDYDPPQNQISLKKTNLINVCSPGSKEISWILHRRTFKYQQIWPVKGAVDWVCAKLEINLSYSLPLKIPQDVLLPAFGTFSMNKLSRIFGFLLFVKCRIVYTTRETKGRKKCDWEFVIFRQSQGISGPRVEWRNIELFLST